jgi:hypothetical protein
VGNMNPTLTNRRPWRWFLAESQFIEHRPLNAQFTEQSRDNRLRESTTRMSAFGAKADQAPVTSEGRLLAQSGVSLR